VALQTPRKSCEYCRNRDSSEGVYGVGDVAAVGADGDRWTVGVEGLRAGVAGVRSEIRPRRSDKMDATCPSSPPLEGADVVG
jgi:hypothetical protein